MVYRLLQKEGAEEKALVGDIIPFEPNPKIQEIQRLLKLYGYNPGLIDGKLGVNTRNAIAKFQKDNNLPVNRFMDQVSWKKLTSFSSSGLIVKGEVDVSKLQMALSYARFSPGKIDGKMGDRTKVAIMQFQKSKGLQVDGKIGFQTLSKLNEFLPESLSTGSSDEAVAAQ